MHFTDRDQLLEHLFLRESRYSKIRKSKRPDIIYFYSRCIVRSKIQIMTEKQYKGISGNFLVCDVQEEYAEYLLSILVKHFGMRFQFHFFSNADKIAEFAQNAEIEILLIAEECCPKVNGYVKAKKKFILSESMKKAEKQGEIMIFRYQSAEEILKIIQSGIGEESWIENKMPEKAEKEHPVTGNDFIAEKGKIRIRDEPEARGLIGVYSPIHRIGKTEFALCLGEKISEKVPALYINMEGYSGSDFYFKGEKHQDLGDLLYYLKQERMDYGLKASLMTGQYKKLDYIMPISNENDLREVTKEEWIYFLDTIMDQCIYEAVILDLGDCVSGLYEILKKCSRIYTPYIQDEVSIAKMRQYEENLKTAGYSDVLKRTMKRQMRAK